MVTRRCYQRTFRLRPSFRTNQIMLYCFAFAAERTGVQIAAVVVMSNHHHVLVLDVEGKISDFMHCLHRLSAKAVNAGQGQWESLWSSHRPHLLRLGDDGDIVAKIAYIAANPVEAGLVSSPREWPGVMRLPRARGHVERVTRPKDYFGERSSAPEVLELRIVAPPIENLDARVEAAIEEKVERARAKMRAKGWAFLGREGVLATSFVKRARSYEKKRKLVPQLAAQRAEIMQRLKEERREFLRAYYEALGRWRAGERDVEFPWGTWWMRVFHGAKVAAAPPS
jgi:REP element-mobilizing transposase RayT